MSHCKAFEPVSEIEMLKRRVEQLERIVAELQRRDYEGSPIYGKWLPPAHIGDPYYLNAPQAAAH